MKRIIFVLTLFTAFSMGLSAQCDPPTILWDEDGLLINWIPKENAESHTLQYRESGTFMWTTVDIPKYTSSFSVTSLTQCIEYDFRVRTICENEESSYSGIYSMRPDCFTCYEDYCEVPQLFSNSVHIASLTMNDVTNTSTFNTDGTGYEDFRGTLDRVYSPGDIVNVEIELGETSFSTPLLVMFIDMNRNLEFEPEEKVIEFQYGYGEIFQSGSFTIPEDVDFGITRMRIIVSVFTNEIPACDYNGFTGETEEYCVLISNLCDADFGLELEGINEDGASFSWDDIEIAEAYNARYKKTSESEEDWVELATIDPEIELGNLEDCNEYEFEVRGVCPFDTSAYKNRIVFNSFCITSTNEEELINSISTYPNPWTDQFTISVETLKSTRAKIELVNNSGQLIGQAIQSNLIQGENKVNLNNFGFAPSGIYFVKITDEEGNSSYHKTLKIK